MEVWKINCFCFSLFLKNNWHLKAATGRCSVKGVLRCAFANEFELFWIVQSRGTLTKLGALRSSHRRVSVKKVFFEISQISQENTYARVSFLIKLQASEHQACNVVKIRLWHRWFPVNFVKFLRTPFLQNIFVRLFLCSLKTCLFAWDIDMFWSIILEDKLKAPWQNGRQN